MYKGLDCKIVEKKGKKTEIEIEGQKVVIPSVFLPASCRSQDQIKLYFLEEEAAKLQQKELAKLILEEILNGK